MTQQIPLRIVLCTETTSGAADVPQRTSNGWESYDGAALSRSSPALDA